MLSRSDCFVSLRLLLLFVSVSVSGRIMAQALFKAPTSSGEDAELKFELKDELKDEFKDVTGDAEFGVCSSGERLCA